MRGKSDARDRVRRDVYADLAARNSLASALESVVQIVALERGFTASIICRQMAPA
jgi:hypothetical protein